MQENRDPPPAFLQNPILAHAKSRRRINHFRILHGRLLEGGRLLTLGDQGVSKTAKVQNATITLAQATKAKASMDDQVL
jgi:hypothetical protein